VLASLPAGNADSITAAPSYCASYASVHHDNLISLPLPLEETRYRQLDIAFILLCTSATTTTPRCSGCETR
jgi:hypothetical protein